jgi:hypothetical protein
MERAAGLAHGDTPQAKLDKLDAVLAQTSTSTRDAALFAEMLSLPNDGRYPALEPDPQRQRQRTLEALNLQMEVLSRSHPVLTIPIPPAPCEQNGLQKSRVKPPALLGLAQQCVR